MRFTQFNEDTRVKIPAIIQFVRLGYEYQTVKDSEVDFNTRIFVDKFKESIERINGKSFTEDEILKLLNEINESISNNDLGKEFYNWLINPVGKVKLIDFENLNNNSFTVVDELPFLVDKGSIIGSFRPDINILINGIPLAFLEVKKPNNDGGIKKEFDRMTKERLKNEKYKKFFNLIQFISFSNNMEYEESNSSDIENIKAGSFYSTPNGKQTSFSFFREDEKNFYSDYKYLDINEEKIKEITESCGYNPLNTDEAEFIENLKTDTPCNKFITSVFDKERFLYFLRYGIIFLETPAKDSKSAPIREKHIMRYPQFFATRAIINRLNSGQKRGIIWHTQGSGKTGLAAFSNRILRDYYSKGGINTRFFFVVDRLDLLRQAVSEFSSRGMTVVECQDKESFRKELNKTISGSGGNVGEVVVVNIQKFNNSNNDELDISKLPKAVTSYGAKVQRVFFIDEAHRSYSNTGAFFANLMSCDEDAVFIALTGTPILSAKERTSLKFGNYIHKYFYDKSTADGYTLKIKRETIDIVAKTTIKENLQIENGKINSADIYESDAFIENIGAFILDDFRNFRLVNSDNSTGAMIVCNSNLQAKKLNDFINSQTKVNLKSGLVMSDDSNPEQKKLNKKNQLNFRNNGTPDILVVHYMLTTGYDVKRLKKLYLLRGPKEQSLLQTISRVNRPYISTREDGTVKVYNYGYIVDFANIEKEYESTLNDYINELEIETIDSDGVSLDGLIIDKDSIYEEYLNCLKELQNKLEVLDIYSVNVESYCKSLNKYNIDDVIFIKKLLFRLKDCYIEFRLSKAEEYLKELDNDKIKKINKFLTETIARIKFLNMKSRPVEMLKILNNEEIVEIIYNCINTGVINLNLGNFGAISEEDQLEIDQTVDILKKVQFEINKNKTDFKIEKLDKLLIEILMKLDIATAIDKSELSCIRADLKKILDEAVAINKENERLASKYNGHFSFVKTVKDVITLDDSFDEKDIEKFYEIVYNSIKDTIDNKQNIKIEGKQGFINRVKKLSTNNFREKVSTGETIYKKLQLSKNFDILLSQLYSNLLLY